MLTVADRGGGKICQDLADVICGLQDYKDYRITKFTF